MKPTFISPLRPSVALAALAAAGICLSQPSPPPHRAESLPAGAAARIGAGAFRVGEIYPAALTPDGRHLLVGRSVLDAGSSMEVGRIPDSLPGGVLVDGVRVSTGGATAALLVNHWEGNSPKRSIVLWDIAKRTAGRNVPIDWRSVPTSFAKEHSLAYSGHIAAIGPGAKSLLFRDSNRHLILWTDLDTTPRPFVLGKSSVGGWYDDAGFTPDGKLILDVGPKIRVWDALTGKLVREFPGPNDVTVRWTVCPDGKRLAVISGTATAEEMAAHRTRYRVSVWDLDAGREIRELFHRLTAHTATSSEVFRLLFTDDGATVVAIDEDRGTLTRPVRRWRTTDGRALPVWPLPWPPGGAGAPFIGPGGKTLYYVTRIGVRTFDLETGAERSPADLRTGGDWPVGIPPDDKHLLTLRGKDRIATWDLATGSLVREERLPDSLPPFGKFFDQVFSTDARLVALDMTVGPKNKRDTRVFERATGRELYRLRGERVPAFIPDGKIILTLSADYKTANTRDAETGNLLRSIACNGDDGFVLSSDGTVFARPWRWNTRAYAIATGAVAFDGREFLLDHLKPHEFHPAFGQMAEPSDTVLAYALCQEGKRFAIAATRYWEAEPRPPQDRVLVFDAAGKKLLWEAKPETGRWFGFNGGAAAFSPDGSLLAIGGQKRLLLFDVATGRELRRYSGHLGTVRYLRFSRDSKHLVSADGDGTVWVWKVSR